MSRYVEYNDELLPIDEVLDKLDNEIGEREEQITQLTNNWNELEEWLKGNDKTLDFNYIVVRVKDVLDKMKEIKERK